MHIVLVEDDEVIRETTQISLERFGYTVTSFEDGREGYEFVTANGADAVLLDLMLPTMNGASITRAIRERSTVPIIVISARSDPIDIVQSLEAGADDYLTKPFDMQVLNARIRAVVRRFITAGTGSMGYSPAPVAAHTVREAAIGPGGRIIGGGELPEVLGPTPGFDSPEPVDTGPLPLQQVPTEETEQWPAAPGAATAAGPEPAPEAAPTSDVPWSSPPGPAGPPGPATPPSPPVTGPQATAPEPASASPAVRRLQLGSLTIDTGRLTVEIDDEEVHLTPTELRILMLLTEEPGNVYSREKMAYTVWGYQWAGDSRVVDVHIQRLRKKIGSSRIETVRGFGYRFAG
ncbi:response regulator transcription factor [Brevibacterium jeotgali]|uniref:Transcriptional regulatory protein, C terminal n=1 Tax=Brevibacterium jeotgali TaxID=1262550 RepID=A0A2H1L5G3_9MICO|nr:response regulator transcription factor [Brevibacterium jeotgali]TWC01362.1 transcriptional regulator [Brevibacterium jeotgali]SMY12141.1 Transcriptional regulatory protein, C terminal [Brevibacterium jeotgali]